LEDLKILLHHYSLNNPLAIPRIIKNRALWANAQRLQEEIDAYPRKWCTNTLGRLLRVTGVEWRMLRLRTIAPIDMTKEEGRAYSRQLYRERRRAKLRQVSRAEYLAANYLSRTRPWEAEGISRRTWQRRRVSQTPQERVTQVGGNKDKLWSDTPASAGWRRESEEGGWASKAAGSGRAEPRPMMVEPSSALPTPASTDLRIQNF
jgi:hypothetical protein